MTQMLGISPLSERTKTVHGPLKVYDFIEYFIYKIRSVKVVEGCVLLA